MTNEVEKRARLQSAMSKAAKLMQLESNGTLDKIAAAHKDGINESLDGGISTQELMTTSRDRKTQGPIPTRQMGQNAASRPRSPLSAMTVIMAGRRPHVCRNSWTVSSSIISVS